MFFIGAQIEQPNTVHLQKDVTDQPLPVAKSLRSGNPKRRSLFARRRSHSLTDVWQTHLQVDMSNSLNYHFIN